MRTYKEAGTDSERSSQLMDDPLKKVAGQEV